jgi:D-inositol-3-phosphate glycosyltransferase
VRIGIVSEHASPLAVLGGADAGGQNVTVAALAAGLAERGVEVTVHTRRDDLGLPHRVRFRPGVTVDHISAGPPEPMAKDLLLPYMDEFAAELRRQWSVERPHVVHSHFWMSGYAALRAAGPLGLAVLHTYHALGVVKKREQGVRDTSPPERIDIETRLLHRADRILATCPDEVLELTRLGGDPGRITIIPCGVDTERYRPEGPAAPRTRRPRLLYVGRLVERKGIGDAISALAGVADAELIIAGGPSPAELHLDAEVGKLTGLARGLGLGERVRFLGRVDRSVLPELYRSADAVVCVPWYEPFGLAAVEAMACGVPVVASAVGGLSDTVIHNVTGLHVPPRCPERVAAALRQLLADPSLRLRLGIAGRIRATEQYSMDGVITKTLHAYTGACTLPPALRPVGEMHTAPGVAPGRGDAHLSVADRRIGARSRRGLVPTCDIPYPLPMSQDPGFDGETESGSEEKASGPEDLGAGIRLEYSLLRGQIAQADQTCVVILGALITATLTLTGLAVSRSSGFLACLLVPLWLIGSFYLAEKRSVIVHTAHYIWTELEPRHAGLNWEGWHHSTTYGERASPARYYPFYLESAIAGAVVLLNPFLVYYITHRWLSAPLLTSVCMVVVFFVIHIRGIILYTRFEKYLATLSVTGTAGSKAAASAAPATAQAARPVSTPPPAGTPERSDAS